MESLLSLKYVLTWGALLRFMSNRQNICSAHVTNQLSMLLVPQKLSLDHPQDHCHNLQSQLIAMDI
jgi:hypothetical protein